jgi:signal transduction histidine kinase
VLQENLGLFDTPPSRREIRLALAVLGLFLAAFLVILPLVDVPLGEVTAFVPVIDAVMCVGELIIATLLFAQAAVFRSRALSLLASGFVFIALLLVPHALAFPGAFTPNGLIGDGTNTTAWVMIFRRWGFPLAVILYVLLNRKDQAAQSEMERPQPMVLVGLLSAMVLAVFVTLLATRGVHWLPTMFLNRSNTFFSNLLLANISMLAAAAAAIGILFVNRRSVLDMWLTVALAGWLIQTLWNLPLHARFTVGWYALFVIMLIANLFVLLALIAESNRLYARLALATAARNREHEARMMSMDAVTAAIAHEVGQPLTAVTANAMAGLEWLRRDPPDNLRATKAMRDTLEAATRTTDVVRSIRAMFAKRPIAASEFSLNDLVRETAAFLDRELAGERVALELTLDEELPPVLADRVQIQRVLVNLFTNAIDSLGATRGRVRRIAVRSAPLNREEVLLEVSDTGIGIAPEEKAHIFDAFFTTKATGTGLGLSLCRTIVEEHGGRLWASPGELHGATFHMQLPRGGVPAL